MKKQEKLFEYTVLFTPDEESGGFTVEIPALPGCVTHGETIAEAKKNAAEAIGLYLQTLTDRGLAIPQDQEPNFFKSKITVPFKLQTI